MWWRVAVEKNIETFLQVDLSGSECVIGDGPQGKELQQRYLQVQFLGAKPHNELTSDHNCTDVMVCLSKADTFGLVIASGHGFWGTGGCLPGFRSGRCGDAWQLRNTESRPELRLFAGAESR